MKVLKFGGTSVGTPENIKKVCEIIIDSNKNYESRGFVVSAFAGITNQLIEMAESASINHDWKESLKQIESRHLQAIEELIDSTNSTIINDTKQHVNLILKELERDLKEIQTSQNLTLKDLDKISGVGELLSAYIIAQTLQNQGHRADFLDTRSVIRTDNLFGNAQVDYKVTNRQIKDYFDNKPGIHIITGFIASNEKGETTTLGRGGSDLTAAVFGAALDASEIEIWTDVDGVLTADPRKVEKAFSLEGVSYNEAMELSHFGAKVIYPPTILPAFEKNIPIRIKNTFNPAHPGTLIIDKSFDNGHEIKCVSSVSDVCLMRFQSNGNFSITDSATRIFHALSRKKIDVLLTTQASSEYSLSFVVKKKAAKETAELINTEFSKEIGNKTVDEVVIEEDVCVLSVIGQNMRNRPGVSGRLFAALGKNGINIKAIAQGSSELNISSVIDIKDQTKALNVVHDAFFNRYIKSVHVYMVGLGLIGSELVTQIKNQTEKLKREKGIYVQVNGLSEVGKQLIESEGIDLDNWKENLDKSAGPFLDLEEYVLKVRELNLPNSVLVDCTASEKVTEVYTTALNNEISIVTPNKKAASGSYATYKSLKSLAHTKDVRYIYEVNVGAGLPVISTLNDLVLAGDNILKIEAILSGTLSYIFNTWDGSQNFSEVIKQAKELGYTEPDPRDDLNGIDVARKVLILAREIGLKLELEDIEIENLVPEECRQTDSIEDFFEKMKKYDEEYQQKLQKAQENNQVLRYIAKIEDGKTKVSLESVDNSHPFYNMKGSDNIISYTTERYKETPLVIKGPGAGAGVTAGGLFADILRVAR